MEDLAYRRLLDQYYMREGPLPSDIEATAKLVRMRSMKADVESVLREFFTLTDAGWAHSRCDAEVEKMQDKQAKARASGLASANARSKAQQAAVERALLSAQADAERSLPSKPTDVQLPTPTPTPTPVLKTRAGGPDLPDWLPQESWAGYVEMRRRIKKPMTDRAMQLRIDDLKKFRDAGHDIAAILDQSTASSWTDLYPPKNGEQQKSRQTDWAARPKWVEIAGFEDVADANASRCYAHNADQFQNGKRIGVPA